MFVPDPDPVPDPDLAGFFLSFGSAFVDALRVAGRFLVIAFFGLALAFGLRFAMSYAASISAS